ncbi:MAG: J domain-containing protein, partial [Actinobacteria bacterium]|nr:J domain-containing protein [Actinomycetota bacterium]
MATPLPDYYEILGVERDATQDEIRSAWRSATRVAHPDAGGSAGLFRLLSVAYETLFDPDTRALYDARRDTGSEPAGDPEAWSDDGDYSDADATAGAYFDDDDDDEWQDVTTPTRDDPIPTRPAWDGSGSDTRLRHRPHHLSLVALSILATVTVAALVATLVISPWWLAGVVAADAVGVACICPRRWERVVVAIAAIFALAELDTIRVGEY